VIRLALEKSDRLLPRTAIYMMRLEGMRGSKVMQTTNQIEWLSRETGHCLASRKLCRLFSKRLSALLRQICDAYLHVMLRRPGLVSYAQSNAEYCGLFAKFLIV